MLLLWLSAPDTYKAIKILREIRGLILPLAASHNHHVVRRVEARIYTHLQKALKGRLKLSQGGVLQFTEAIFNETKRVFHPVRQSRGLLVGNVELMTELLHSLELLLKSSTGRRALLRGFEFEASAASMKEGLKCMRGEIFADEAATHQNAALASIADLESWLEATRRLAGITVKRHLGKGSR